MTLPTSPWAGAAAAVAALRNTDPTGKFVRHVSYEPLLTARHHDGGRQRLVHEDTITRLLTLQRNSISGAVHRRVGAYDVLAVSRVTVGYCRLKNCTDASAVNVLGSRYRDYYNKTHLPLLTHTDDSGVQKTISIVDEDLLSLGRAAVADPSWFGGDNDSWALRAGFNLYASTRLDETGRMQRVVDPLGPRWCRHCVVDMAHPSSATKAYTAKWLQAVAYVFCRPPLSSFVAGDGYQLCGQPEGRADPHVAATAGGTAVQAHDAEWTFDPDQRAGRPDRPAQPGATPLPPCAFPDDSAAGGIDWPRDRPAWLLGRGSREVNPASADEVALAQSIAACAHPLGAKRFVELRRIKWSPAARYGPAIGVAESLSHRFDGAVWGVEPPDDPTSATNLILALSVVVPAALALVTVLMTGRSWSKRDVAALVLVFVAGLVSSAGLVGLAVVEARAQAWRGASLRNELAVRIHENGNTPVMRHLTHMPLYRVETLYLAARTGYRLNLIVSLASVVLSAYVVLFAAVTCCAAYRWRRPKKGEPARPRTPRSPRDRLGGGGVVASDEVDIEARVESPSPGGRVPHECALARGSSVTRVSGSLSPRSPKFVE